MVDRTDLRAGKCFLSAGAKPQVLRIRGVQSGAVHFEAITRGPNSRSVKGETPLEEFLAGVQREVGCDFVPGSEQRIHV